MIMELPRSEQPDPHDPGALPPRGRPDQVRGGPGGTGETSRTVTSRARARAVARSGQPAVPPGARVDAEPTAQPSATAAGRSRPSSSPAMTPALKQCPAPVVSATVTGGGSARERRGPAVDSAPRSPSLTAS